MWVSQRNGTRWYVQFEHQEFFVYMCTFELSKDIYALMKRAKRKKKTRGVRKKLI